MKKIILIISVFFITSGCSNYKEEIDMTNIMSTEDIFLEEDKYVDDNPIKISLYSGYNKITDYSTTLANFKDIGVFEIYYTDLDKLDSDDIKNNYLKYYNEYEDIEKYKVGFYVSFEADSKKIEELILDPSKQHAMTPYLYIYLYDDINQEPGAYYSHLEPNDVNKSTIYSSIKLFLAQEGVRITSPITVTVFTYDDEDDFEDEKYRGNSNYTIQIDIKEK